MRLLIVHLVVSFKDGPPMFFLMITSCNEDLPVIEPNGEMDVHSNISLRELLQQTEHTSCSSGRARPIFIIAERCL